MTRAKPPLTRGEYNGFAVGDEVVIVTPTPHVRVYTRGGKQMFVVRGMRAAIVDIVFSGPALGWEYRLRFDRNREPLVRPFMDGVHVFDHVSVVDKLARLA
jgi:hypothetical protein